MRRIKPHLAYLRYVLLHKLYVFMAGIAIYRTMGGGRWVSWVWRLLVHDLSKFRPSEWRPYVAYFYALSGEAWIEHHRAEASAFQEPSRARQIAEARWGEEKKLRQARFNYAWLLHQHRNAHHWQYWTLKEDSGRTYLLVPPAPVVDEMLADWLGAGAKILQWPTLAECVALTVKWYMDNRTNVQLREVPRARIEATLHGLAARYGLLDLAYQVRVAQQGRTSLALPASRR